jgi:hypothetical protein
MASTLAGDELNAENLVGYITGAKTGNGAPDPSLGTDAGVS